MMRSSRPDTVRMGHDNDVSQISTTMSTRSSNPPTQPMGTIRPAISRIAMTAGNTHRGSWLRKRIKGAERLSRLRAGLLAAEFPGVAPARTAGLPDCWRPAFFWVMAAIFARGSSRWLGVPVPSPVDRPTSVSPAGTGARGGE